MSLFSYRNPLSTRKNNSWLDDSIFDDFNNELFNHPLVSYPSLYPYYYNPVHSLEKQISKAFDKEREIFKSVDFTPKINLSEDENNYYIHADLPGMNKDQVKMEISDEDRTLTISGERETIIDHSKDNENENETEATNTKNNNNESPKESNNATKDKKYSKIECSYGKFSRSFSIPENADIDHIQAKMDNGVLEVTIQKLEPTKQEPKRSIQIQ